MSLSKELLFEEMEKADKEIVAACDWCCGPVTNAELNEMPYDDGAPVFIMCGKCRERNDAEVLAEMEPTREVACRYCHYKHLHWVLKPNGKWQLFTEAGRPHLCKPFLAHSKKGRHGIPQR